MRIARPWRLELDYTREMMASLLLPDDARFPRNVLLIGLGAASLTKSFCTVNIRRGCNAHPGELDMLPFYQMCRARLNDNGVLAVNLLGRSRGYQASLERIKQHSTDAHWLSPPATAATSSHWPQPERKSRFHCMNSRNGCSN